MQLDYRSSKEQSQEDDFEKVSETDRFRAWKYILVGEKLEDQFKKVESAN